MCLCLQRLAQEALTLVQERSQGRWVKAEHGERTLWEPVWPLCQGEGMPGSLLPLGTGQKAGSGV